MTYGVFAQVYDELMDSQLFPQWKDYTVRHLPHKGAKILELACGNGELAILLKKAGYDIQGLDLSPEMLTIAKIKQEEAGVSFPLIQADMRDLAGFSIYDGIISFCDSLCYLPTPEDLRLVFQQVYEHLEEKGVFLFDVFTTIHIQELDGYAYHAELPGIVFTWDSYKGKHEYSIEHELSFFKELDNGHYERFNEVHRERTYPLAFYKKELKQAGFTNIEITADFVNELAEDSIRWFFKAEK